MQYVRDLAVGHCRELHVHVPGTAAKVSIGALYESIESWRARTGRVVPDVFALIAAGDFAVADRTLQTEVQAFSQQAGVTGFCVYSSPFLTGPLAAGITYTETELVAEVEAALAAGAIVDQGYVQRSVSRAKLNGGDD